MVTAIALISACAGYFIGYAVRIENREDKKITEINEALKKISSKI